MSWWSAQPQQLVLNSSHSFILFTHLGKITPKSHQSSFPVPTHTVGSSIPALFLVLHGHACSLQVARATPGMADGSTKASDSSFLHARQAQSSWGGEERVFQRQSAQITTERWQSSSDSTSSNFCLFNKFCLPPTLHSHSPFARNHELHQTFPLTPPLHNGPRLQRRSCSSWMLQNPWILLQHSLQHRREDLFTLDSIQNYLFCLETACDGVSLCIMFNSSVKCQEARGHEHSAKTTSLQFKPDNNLPADSFGKKEKIPPLCLHSW